MTLLASVFEVTTVASAAPEPTSAGGIGVRLIADASRSSAGPLTLSYVVERLAPGRRVVRQIEISNTTNAAAHIVVYPAAASYVKGKFSFAPGRTEDSLSSWTRVARSVLDLARGARAIDALTIKVPRRTAPGERYAVVWAEVSAPSPTQSGVRLVNRVGIRMYVSVGKGGLPVANFTVGAIVARRSSNGDPFIVSKVRNLGQTVIEVTGRLTLSKGPGGLSAGPFFATTGTLIAPRHSQIERVQLSSQIPRGPWRADLTLSSNGTRRSSLAIITFPERTPAGEQRSLVAPLVLAVLIVLVLSVSGSIFISRRRRLRLNLTAIFERGEDTR